VLSRGKWRTVENLACPVMWRPHLEQIASGTDRIRPARLRGLVAGAGLGARWARRRCDVAGDGSDGGDAEGETLGNQVTTSQWAGSVHSLREQWTAAVT